MPTFELSFLEHALYHGMVVKDACSICQLVMNYSNVPEVEKQSWPVVPKLHCDHLPLGGIIPPQAGDQNLTVSQL